VEDPGALITRVLIDARFPVIAVHPLAVARFRGGHTPAGPKSDRSDALTLANLIRLEPGAHRPVPRDSPQVLALRALGRQYRVRRQQRAGLDLQLRAQASRFYPAAARALTRRPRRDMLAALAVAPSPGIALHVRSGRISEALREAGRTRSVPRAAAEILSELRTPFPRLPCLIEAGHGEALADTVGLLRAVDGSVERLQASLLAGAARHGAWPIVSSFPGLGQVTGALVLSEIGDDPARFSSARGLLCLAGVAPVTRQSGGMLSVRRRRIRNRPLALAVTDWALPLLSGSEFARALYDDRRAKGDRHNAASRRVLARYLRGLHHCLRTGELFDETRMVAASPRA
jgi:transposase